MYGEMIKTTINSVGKHGVVRYVPLALSSVKLVRNESEEKEKKREGTILKR